MTDQQHRVEYGVVLDDQGSTDTYDTEAEARAHATAGSPIVRIVTTPIDEPSVQRPTREQIVDALYRAGGGRPPGELDRIWRLKCERQADVVLALFQQPTPEQECGVCGRRYPASDTRGTCPVCWPGFGEHGQQPTPSAEPDDLKWCHLCGAVLDGTADDRRVHRHAFEGLRPPEDDEPTAEPASIADTAPGTTACADPNVNRWYCQRRADGTCPLPKCAHPSTIRDVTPPPATPEAGR